MNGWMDAGMNSVYTLDHIFLFSKEIATTEFAVCPTAHHLHLNLLLFQPVIVTQQLLAASQSDPVQCLHSTRSDLLSLPPNVAFN